MAHALWRRTAGLENVRSKATVLSLSLHPIICLGLWKNFSHGNRSAARHLKPRLQNTNPDSYRLSRDVQCCPFLQNKK